MMYIARMSDCKYFVYRHVRMDTGEPFYVGCGKKGKPSRIHGYRTEYSRAFETVKRNKHWKDVASKTKYHVEILQECQTKEEGYEKEMEFISLYGRACAGEGPLTNRTSGGSMKDYPRDGKIRVTQLTLEGSIIKIWDDMLDAEVGCGYLKTNIVKCCRKKALSAYGYKWEYTDDRSFDDLIPSAKRTNSVKGGGLFVLNKHTGVQSFYRARVEAAKALSIHVSTIQRYISGKRSNPQYEARYTIWLLENKNKAKELGFDVDFVEEKYGSHLKRLATRKAYAGQRKKVL